MEPMATAGDANLAPHAPHTKAVGGAARRARFINMRRAEVPDDEAGATLVLDAGDHFTGSPYFEFLQGLAAAGSNAACNPLTCPSLSLR
jgi:2',3'-cyclic-nucleotide 2'-phosphodiesterase (5'-nucleotidase family)